LVDDPESLDTETFAAEVGVLLKLKPELVEIIGDGFSKLGY
jgi:hypothetical protein